MEKLHCRTGFLWEQHVSSTTYTTWLFSSLLPSKPLKPFIVSWSPSYLNVLQHLIQLTSPLNSPFLWLPLHYILLILQLPLWLSYLFQSSSSFLNAKIPKYSALCPIIFLPDYRSEWLSDTQNFAFLKMMATIFPVAFILLLTEMAQAPWIQHIQIQPNCSPSKSIVPLAFSVLVKLVLIYLGWKA